MKALKKMLRIFCETEHSSLSFNAKRYSVNAMEINEQNISSRPKPVLSWQIKSFHNEELELAKCSIPIIENSKHVLIKVHSSSINPLDLEMKRGYGSVLLRHLRFLDSPNAQLPSLLPTIPGRDFSGIVAAKGDQVSEIRIGDEVYGVVKPQNQGCHAQYAITEGKLVAKRPEFLSMEEASGIMYTGLTAWSALKISGGLLLSGMKNKKILVIGGSGGVGNMAIQLSKAWGLQVATTCSDDAFPLVEKLGADLAVSYLQNETCLSQLSSFGKFDIVLDAAGLDDANLVKYIPLLNSCGSLITLKSPLLKNIDSLGMVGGLVKSVADIAVPNLTSGILTKGGLIKWAYFIPSAVAVEEIAHLVKSRKIVPVIQDIYGFDELPKAYERMEKGHLRGKIVLSDKWPQKM